MSDQKMTPGHNTSPEIGVAPNQDPALNLANEHHHTHHNHAGAALKTDDNVEYTRGTTPDKSNVPDASPLDGHQAPAYNKESVQVRDAEKGGLSPSQTGTEDDNGPNNSRRRKTFAKGRLALHLIVWLFFTGWWIATLVLHRNDMNWVVPFLLWLAVTLRVITFYVPVSIVMNPAKFLWRNSGSRIATAIPEKLRAPAGGALVVGVFLIGSFIPEESRENTRANRAISLLGLALMIIGLWATSRKRSAIKWHTVIVGMLVQFIVAIFVLKSQAGYDIFAFISGLARSLLGFANQGTAFLTSQELVDTTFWFLITVIPAIIFFVALVQLLYYWGLLQWFIGKFAVFFFWSMRVSGAEAVVAAASPFIGQGESAMLIRPFVAHLTRAEIHQIMTSGFATIAGSVLVAYIGFGINPQALVSSCVMSIPASLAISKLRYPEEEETLTAGRVVIPDDDEHRAANALHAFANGAWLGLKIAGMIVSTLLCILALLGLVNGLMTWWGRYLNINDPPLTINLLVGYICYPVAFLLGVPIRHDIPDNKGQDLYLVGKLIGTKIIINEFVAFSNLQNEPEFAVLSDRARLIATYALCGFGNIGSLGTQIGVLSQISPSRSGDVSRVAVSALLAGILSTLSSASVAGMLVTDQAASIAQP